MPRYIDTEKIRLFTGFFEKIDNVPKFYEWLETLPTADEEKIATEYCMKRCLVMITMDSYEKLIAYYNRATGLDAPTADVVSKELYENDDLISRQAAIDLAKDLCVPTKDGSIYRHRCIDPDAIRELPSAQPERKRGKWEVCNILDYAQRPSGRKILRCPFCGYLTDEFRSRVDYYRVLTNFCPNCGAEMRKETEDANYSQI